MFGLFFYIKINKSVNYNIGDTKLLKGVLKMKIYNFINIFVLSVFLFCFSCFKVNSFQNSRVILIDPGHGGIDGGAVSISNFLEKDLNLQISMTLRDMLLSKGYKVFMTRDKDVCLSENSNVKQKKREDLNKRCAMKREVSCDIFLSIHMNKFPDSSVKGSQVWYPTYSEKSKTLALLMHEKFRKFLGQQGNREPKGVKNDYVVLRDGYEGASLIVECGFISNREEEEKLKSASYQNQICNAMVLAIEEYFSGVNLN